MTELSDHDLHRKTARASLATRVFVLFVSLALAALLVGIGIVVAEIRHGQVQNHSTLVNTADAAKSAQDTAEAIHSCVTPGEPCFERAQRQTADAVSNINRVIIAAAACAVGQTGTRADIQSAIQACVIDDLARQNAHR